MKPLINLTFASKLESRRILAALMSRCMILGWPEDSLSSKGDLIYDKKIFIRFAINVDNKENSQSSCRYANPFAQPIAIFSLVGQFIVGLSNSAMSIFLNKTLYSSFTVHKVRWKLVSVGSQFIFLIWTIWIGSLTCLCTLKLL